ncbi:MAG: TRAP transporter large permease subunit [Calditrichaeota bacterium]|nr:TRAP transporter large permease subunit [Candidatus Cloacimonadota bacterium]MCB1047092.1 TRAP transporter large permease subunit [Calditrichota bacterium]MCB9474815.1 TRAP transporter large permease subunit [Candidatus Delongbacteria bacterium]
MTLWILLGMVAWFAAVTFRWNWPIGLGLASAAALGGLVAGVPPWAPGGDGLLRHLVEGSFVYIDPILIMATALVFMKAIEASGLLPALSVRILRGLAHRPMLLAILMGAFIAFPGMLTGLTTASVLTTGAIAAPPLMKLGLDRRRTGAFIAICAIIGMVAPPINLPVMIIGGGVDMPYIGFTVPLLVLTLPTLVFTALFLAWPSLRKGDARAVLAGLDDGPWQRHGVKLLLPLLLVLVLMSAPQLFPGRVPSLGLPLVFLLGALLAMVTGDRVRLVDCASAAVRQALPVMAILVGVGCFIQVMTLTGMRGELVLSCLELPHWLLFVSMLFALPMFGAVSAFGSASVLGVPFLLALLGRPELWVAAGLSMLAALGDLMPPTALSGIFAAQVVGEEKYTRVLRHCLVPALLLAGWGLATILFAAQFAAVFTPAP